MSGLYDNQSNQSLFSHRVGWGEIDLRPFARVQQRNDDEAIPAGWILWELWDQKSRTELDRTRHGLITSCMRGVDIWEGGQMVFVNWVTTGAPTLFFYMFRQEDKHQAVLGATLCMYILLANACEAQRRHRSRRRGTSPRRPAIVRLYLGIQGEPKPN